MLLYTLLLWRYIQVPGRVFPPSAMVITLLCKHKKNIQRLKWNAIATERKK